MSKRKENFEGPSSKRKSQDEYSILLDDGLDDEVLQGGTNDSTSMKSPSFNTAEYDFIRSNSIYKEFEEVWEEADVIESTREPTQQVISSANIKQPPAVQDIPSQDGANQEPPQISPSTAESNISQANQNKSGRSPPSRKNCSNCGESFIYEKSHYRKYINCAHAFASQHFIDTVGLTNYQLLEKIQKHIKNCRRQSYPSRSKSNRQLEHEKVKNDFKKALNTFIKSKFSIEYSHCCSICHRMVKDNDFSHSNDSKVCTKCGSESSNSQTFSSDKTYVNLTKISKFSVPSNRVDENSDNELAEYVLLPNSSKPVTEVNSVDLKICKSSIEKVHLKPYLKLDNKFHSFLYDLQLKKLLDKKTWSGLVKGIILDSDEKSIKINKKISTSDSIKGTSKYDDDYFSDLQWSIYHNGPVFLSCICDIDYFSTNTLFYIISQTNDYLVEVDFKFNEDQLLEPAVLVHPKHLGPCNDTCNKVTLEELYLNSDIQNSDIINGNLSHSVGMFLEETFRNTTNLVKRITACENYSARIFFDEHKASVKIALWPKHLKQINEKLANNDSLSYLDIKEFEDYIDSNFCASSNSVVISSFNIPEDTTSKISQLARIHQVTDNNQHNLSFVSEKTKIKNSLIGIDNDFITKFEESYVKAQLNFYELLVNSLNLTLDGFLDDLRANRDFHFEQKENLIKLTLPGFENLELVIDDHFRTLLNICDPLLATYERVITFKKRNVLFDFVMKRPNLPDIRTLTFMPHVLFAIQNKVEAKIVTSKQYECAEQLSFRKQIQIPDELKDIAEKHCIVSHLESLFIADPRKKLIIRNVSPINVPTKPSDLVTFSKCDEENIESYFDIETGKPFLKIATSYEKYVDRINCDELCFAQFLSCYQNIADKGSEQTNSVENFETSDYIANAKQISLELPNILKLNSGKQIKKRGVKKPLKYPVFDTYSDSYKRIQILLYVPHNETLDLDNHESIERIFNEKTSPQVYDKAGKILTKIEATQNHLFKCLCFKFHKNIFEPNFY